MIGIGFFTHHKYQKSMQEPHGHGHEPHLTSAQDEESHPLTSRGAASSSHARGDSSAGSGGFWGFPRVRICACFLTRPNAKADQPSALAFSQIARKRTMTVRHTSQSPCSRRMSLAWQRRTRAPSGRVRGRGTSEGERDETRARTAGIARRTHLLLAFLLGPLYET